MSISIVSTSERPDLVEVTARWRWEAFFRKHGRPFEDVLAGAQRTAATVQTMPQTFVLLAGGEPIGTASLVAHDLDERPNLTPWLAGVFVSPDARGHGHAARLITAVEAAAAQAGFPVLWLYTNTAERVYARAGWEAAETVQRKGKPYTVMRRMLSAPPSTS